MRTVRQLLGDKSPRVISIAPDRPVIDAIRLMAEQHIGAVLVLEDERISGIVSERDYARKVILMGRSSKDTQVHEVMSSPVITVGPNDTVNHCMRLMTERRIRHLPVTEESGAVVGVVSIGDLVRAVIEDQQQEIEQLQHYIAG